MLRSLPPLMLLALLPFGNARADWTRAAWANPKEALVMTTVDSLIFCATWGGNYQSRDGGVTWDTLDVGFGNFVTVALATMGKTVFAGTVSGVRRSSDLGAHWEAANGALTKHNVDVLGAVGTNLYAGMHDSGLYRSPDQGASWSKLDITGLNPWVMSFAGSSPTVFVGTQGGFYRSLDDGLTWNTLAIGQSSYLYVSAMAQSGSTLFASISGKGVFKSTDNGSTWTAANSGLPDLQPYALAVDGDILYCGTSKGVYRSGDQGKSWTTVAGGLVEWIEALAVHRGKLFACAKTGLWIRPLAEMASSLRTQVAASEGFDRQSRSGGPLRPGEAIRFSLNAPARTRLSWYDARGNLVSILQDAWLRAGRHEAALPAAGIPAGKCLLKLDAGEFSQSIAFSQLK